MESFLMDKYVAALNIDNEALDKEIEAWNQYMLLSDPPKGDKTYLD
jgi:hypothetical protein